MVQVTAMLIPLLALSQPVNGLVFVADGVLQGAKAFRVQAISMVFATSLAGLLVWS